MLTKIVLAWDRQKETERDSLRGLGRYLYEVRAGQYWRLEILEPFDEFRGVKEMPVLRQLEAASSHHMRFRSQAGHDTEQNLITLCAACHANSHRGE